MRANEFILSEKRRKKRKTRSVSGPYYGYYYGLGTATDSGGGNGGGEGVAEGKMAELDMDLEDPEITDRQFEKIYGMTRKEARELFSRTNIWDFPQVRDPDRPLHEQGVAEGTDYEREPLYHATLKAFEPSIMKSGLLPGGNLRMFDWSDGKYVYLSNYPDIARDFIDPGVIEPNKEHEEQILELMKQGGVILKIDQNKLNRNLLTADPHFSTDADDGAETYIYSGVIPPSAIIGKEYFSITESTSGVAKNNLTEFAPSPDFRDEDDRQDMPLLEFAEIIKLFLGSEYTMIDRKTPEQVSVKFDPKDRTSGHNGAVLYSVVRKQNEYPTVNFQLIDYEQGPQVGRGRRAGTAILKTRANALKIADIIYNTMGLPKQDRQVEENFADGRNPGRKGLAKRMGVPTKASVSRLRQIAKSSSGEKQRMAHWLANMKAGRKK